MIYQLILLQLSAHLLADFVFQPQKWTDRKSEKIFSAHHILHTVVVFVTSFLFSLDFGFWKAALIIALIHLLIDSIKSYMLLKYYNSTMSRYLFFADQTIHIVILIIVSIAYYHFCEVNFMAVLTLKNTSVIAGFILCAKPTNVFIKNIFTIYDIAIPPISDTENSDRSLPNAGKLIGVMERFMTLALILSSQYAAVGLIIAAKSILRFSDTQKNEYVLVGTLLSFGIAVLTGILINQI